MHRIFNTAAKSVGVAAAAACLFFAGAAYAEAKADSLDQAHQRITQAIDLLKQPDGTSDATTPHRDKAAQLLTRAQSEVLKAKQVAK